MELTKLHVLKKRWRKRREKLRKEAEALGKNAKRSVANRHHSDVNYGRFHEVEKCASELASILGGMQKAGTVEVRDGPKVKAQCLQCQSYKSSYNHVGGIYPHFCIRMQRSIYPEMYDGKHPKDCPDNKFRKLAGLKCR